MTARLAANKKASVSNAIVTRRAALGDLVNRTDKLQNVAADPKKPSQIAENGKAFVNGLDLKKVKARVDTHWTNEPIQRKPLTRSNSLRSTGITNSGSGSGSGSTNGTSALVGIPKLVRTRALETDSVKHVTFKRTTLKQEKPKSQENHVPKVRSPTRAQSGITIPKVSNALEVANKKATVSEIGRYVQKPLATVHPTKLSDKKEVAALPRFSHSENLLNQVQT